MMHQAGLCANFHCIPGTAYVMTDDFSTTSAVKQTRQGDRSVESNGESGAWRVEK